MTSASLPSAAITFVAPVNPLPFLVFEGLDGSGKSTLMHAVVEHLRASGASVTITREPGGTPLAEEIRRIILRTDGEVPVAATELLLYAASRAQHVAGVIQPALSRGEWVLCDRFTASSVAFQCFARGVSREDTNWLNHFARQGTVPSLTILLDLTVSESQRRQVSRSGVTGQTADRIERESRDFHERVRQGFLAQAKEDPAQWLVLDATRTPEELQAEVLTELRSRQWLR